MFTKGLITVRTNNFWQITLYPAKNYFNRHSLKLKYFHKMHIIYFTKRLFKIRFWNFLWCIFVPDEAGLMQIALTI